MVRGCVLALRNRSRPSMVLHDPLRPTKQAKKSVHHTNTNTIMYTKRNEDRPRIGSCMQHVTQNPRILPHSQSNFVRLVICCHWLYLIYFSCIQLRIEDFPHSTVTQNAQH